MSERETVGEIIAMTKDYDGCHERIRQWESREDWEKTDPGEVATDREDAEFWNLRADSVLAAGYAKPRTVTTDEELNALPGYSVVLDCGDCVYMKGSRGQVWFYPGDLSDYISRTIGLPATVLYTPTDAGSET